MKMKKVIGALGIIVILVGTVYVGVKHFEKKKEENKNDSMHRQSVDDRHEVSIVTTEKED